jgi:hypothetical protein
MTNPVNTAFVISPFGEPFDTYFAHILKPALEDSGLYAVRGDSLYRPTTIVDDIWQGIRDAKLLIAELTGRNPNVFYELGLAHAISKPVILLSESIEDVPFDLRSIRVLLYDKNHPDWGNKLRAGLMKAIDEVLRSPTTAIPSTFKIPVQSSSPEESETLLRLEALESMVRRFADAPLTVGGFPDVPDSFYTQGGFRPVDPRIVRHEPLKLQPGDTVMHSKFGIGEVIALEGKGKDSRAQINFEKVGAKWLALAVAKLDVMNSHGSSGKRGDA